METRMWSIDFRLPAAALGLLALASAPGSLWAQESTATRLRLEMSGDEPIQIESDKLEVRESENIAIFSGNVSVTQGPTLLKSGKMTVYYAKDGGSAATGSANIDRLEVDGCKDGEAGKGRVMMSITPGSQGQSGSQNQ